MRVHEPIPVALMALRACRGCVRRTQIPILDHDHVSLRNLINLLMLPMMICG